MPWIAVNSSAADKATQSPPEIKLPSQELQIVSSTASKYRINILKAAEILVNHRPRKRKRSKTSSNIKSTKSKVNGSASNCVDNEMKGISGNTPDETLEDKSSFVLQPKATLQNLMAVTLPRRASIQQDETLNLNSEHTVQEDSKVSFPDSRQTKLESTVPLDAVDIVHGHQASSLPDMRIVDPIITEISSDYGSSVPSCSGLGDSDFELSDDGLFDEILGTSAQSETTETSDLPTTLPQKPTHPNGSPYSPFMHPCLLDFISSKASVRDKQGSPVPGVKHTCFRTAEVLRLSKHLKRASAHKHEEFKIETFATVHEVKYANCQGHGQGIVFSDIFFPNKPPYITAMSRIPYSVRNFASPTQQKNDTKPVFKVTLLLSQRPITALTRSRLTNTSKVVQKQQLNSPATNLLSFEALDVQPSSWTEIQSTKSMIEKDHKARSGEVNKANVSMPKHFVPERVANTAESGQAGGRLIRQNTQDLVVHTGEDEFSDTDMSLPDLEELFKAGLS